MKVLSVFGTRPEAIKMAPVVHELEKRSGVESIVCVTAQHREMLDQVLDFFKIKPDYDLDVMSKNQTLAGITSKVLLGLQDVFEKEKPDLVLVHGDTTTTFSGALAAYYSQCRVGHVEAGLRTYNIYSPFPEEMNRLLVGDIADIHFAPTEHARNNLLKEGVSDQSIHVTGNTSVDALGYTYNEAYSHSILDWVGDSKFILLTIHRRENLGKPLRSVMESVKAFLEKNKDYKVVYPIHLNPIIRKVAGEILDECENIKIVDPLGVYDFHNILSRAHLVLTDSGGIQEEAPHFGVPTFVLRDTTERPEAVEAGTAAVIGLNSEKILDTLEKIKNTKEYNKMSHKKNPYGDGTAARRIVDAILDV